MFHKVEPRLVFSNSEIWNYYFNCYKITTVCTVALIGIRNPSLASQNKIKTFCSKVTASFTSSTSWQDISMQPLASNRCQLHQLLFKQAVPKNLIILPCEKTWKKMFQIFETIALEIFGVICFRSLGSVRATFRPKTLLI